MADRVNQDAGSRKAGHYASKASKEQRKQSGSDSRYLVLGQSVPIARKICTETKGRKIGRKAGLRPGAGAIGLCQALGGAMRQELRLSREADDEMRHTILAFNDSGGREIQLSWSAPVAGSIWWGRRFGRLIVSFLALVAALLTIWAHSCGAASLQSRRSEGPQHLESTYSAAEAASPKAIDLPGATETESEVASLQ